MGLTSLFMHAVIPDTILYLCKFPIICHQYLLHLLTYMLPAYYCKFWKIQMWLLSNNHAHEQGTLQIPSMNCLSDSPTSGAATSEYVLLRRDMLSSRI